MISIVIPSANEKNADKVALLCANIVEGAQVIISNDQYRQGKGWAIKQGLYKTTGDVIIFLDGDMDIHPRMIHRLLPFLEDYDIVVGKKKLPDIPSRRVISFLSRLFIKFLFGLDVDTQTGIKAFRRGAIPMWSTDGYAFDIEVIARAKRMGMRIVEVPVEAKVTRKMPLSTLFKTLKDTLKIWTLIRK